MLVSPSQDKRSRPARRLWRQLQVYFHPRKQRVGGSLQPRKTGSGAGDRCCPPDQGGDRSSSRKGSREIFSHVMVVPVISLAGAHHSPTRATLYRRCKAGTAVGRGFTLEEDAPDSSQEEDKENKLAIRGARRTETSFWSSPLSPLAGLVPGRTRCHGVLRCMRTRKQPRAHRGRSLRQGRRSRFMLAQKEQATARRPSPPTWEILGESVRLRSIRRTAEIWPGYLFQLAGGHAKTARNLLSERTALPRDPPVQSRMVS